MAANGETRALGVIVCTALVVGNTIGMGIFMMPASLAPFGLNALPAWLITAAGCIFIAWVFAGLARSFPDDDGPYAYASRAFGNGIAFILLWCYWVSTFLTNATIAIALSGYLSSFFPVLGSNRWLAAIVALALLWLFVLINLRGVRTAGGVQVVSTVLKLLPQVAIVALGVWELLLAPHARQHLQLPTTPLSLSGLMGASAVALFAMLGVESAAMPAGRVRDPARTIPRATFAGTLIVAVIYICISMVPLLLIPQSELAVSNAPFADLFARFGGAGSGKLLAAFVIISGLGALNGWTLILGELTVSFARHGGFPPSLGKLNAQGAPTRALVLTGLLASAMLLINCNDSTAGIFTFLSEVVTAANLPMYIGCALAVVALWRSGRIAQPTARDLRWIAAALVATVYCIWVFIGMGAKPFLWALLLGAAGIPVYWWYALRREAVAAPST
ncbi:MAG TPA: amino acid permease [Steroidobacteraceae bacterium]|jgi:APA family basic amino acid/polyamine antiporter|nr:amino acid permease [Steroidobacteraceae bacterium]